MGDQFFRGGTIMRLTQGMCVAILLCALSSSASAQEGRKAISKPTPRYPEVAKQLKLVGTVKVEVVIGADGKVKNTNIIGGYPVLIDAKLISLEEWTAEPAKNVCDI